MGRHYNEASLKEIGKRCANKFPPASTMQAMFMYQMQCQSDAEELFHGQLFQLAKMEDETQVQDKRIWELEEQMKDLSKKALTEDIEQRLATSKVRTDALASRLNEHFVRLGDHSRRLTELETTSTTAAAAAAKQAAAQQINDMANEIKEMKSTLASSEQKLKATFASVGNDIKELQVTTRSAKGQDLTQLTTIRDELTAVKTAADLSTNELKSALEKADQEIQMLFDERDALFTLLNESNKSIEELDMKLTSSTKRTDTLASLLSKSNQRCDELSSLLNQANKQAATFELKLNDAKERIWKLEDERETQKSERIDELEKLIKRQIELLQQSKDRMEKLEDNVRALTLQKTSPPSSADASRSPSVRHCPVTTSNGDHVDLVVPKGKPHVSLKRDEIRSFIPGSRGWGS